MSKLKTLFFIIVLLPGICFRADAFERWWNYYSKGIDYTKDGKWAEAAEAFKMALNQDSTDRRRARTYGMHFIEYYPHRWLGTAYFNLKDFDKAVAELSLSLSQVEDAATRRLLDEARQLRALAVSKDVSPPQITLNSPPNGSYVNTLSAVINGTASDDLYVATVSINGKPASITPGRETAFSYTAALTPGKNTFTIEARDGSEKTSRKILTLICDTEPPLITTNLPDAGLVVTSPSLELRGVITDNMSIESLAINGESITGHGSKIAINKTLALVEGDNKILIEGRDSAGNIAVGTIIVRLDTQAPEIAVASPKKGMVTASRDVLVKGTVRDSRGISSISINGMPIEVSGQQFESFSRTISLKPGETAVVIKAKNTIGNESEEIISIGIDTDGPAVLLSEFPDNMIIYNVESFAFRGTASDPSGVAEVSINQSRLSISPGAQVMFSYSIPLQEGENAVEISATDKYGNERTIKKIVRRETKDIKKIGARLAVAMVQFERKGSALDWNIEQALTEALLGVGRFKVVEKMKIDEILREQAFGASGAVDQASAARIGRLSGADAIMIGSINSIGDHIEIDVRLVDSEGGAVITAHSVYGERTNPESRRRMVEELAQKLRTDFPMVDGMVVQVEREKLYVDIGARQGIKKDTKCIVYRDEEPVKHPITGEVLGYKTREVGSVILREVYDKMSEAVVVAKNIDIRIGDRIVTK